MTYLDKWELAVNKDNINLVMMAMVDVALGLLDEPATDPTVAAYAAACLNSPQSYAVRITLGVVFVATATNDAAIRTAVLSVLPAYAGVQAV